MFFLLKIYITCNILVENLVQHNLRDFFYIQFELKLKMIVITIKESFNVYYFIGISQVQNLIASEISLNQNVKTIIQGMLV